jgi:YidC/Oxa1 family membrane protein insertase
MLEFFNLILTRPILNLLMWLYDVVPGQDIGIAIIILTVIVKVLLYPMAQKQIKQQKALQELQPKIDEVRKTYKDDKEEQARRLMALYKEEKVNPAASCLPLIIQLPIFLALFHVLRSVLGDADLGGLLYSFVPHPGQIEPTFLGFVDLKHPNYTLAILAGAVQFVQAKQIMARGATKTPPKEVEGTPAAKDESMAAMMNKQMVYMMPVITVVIGFSLPGGLILYWLTMSVLTVVQQWYMLSYKKKKEGQQEGEAPAVPV